MTEVYPNPRVQRPAPQMPITPAPAVGLLQAITEFVKCLPLPQLQRVAPTNAPLAYQPKILLALLTFFYAHRIYPSSEIELAVRGNHSLRALCGQEYPDASLLRRFRRQNRDSIRECLAYVLARSAGACEAKDLQQPCSFSFPSPFTRTDGHLINLSVLQEAERRIANAILLDSAEADST